MNPANRLAGPSSEGRGGAKVRAAAWAAVLLVGGAAQADTWTNSMGNGAWTSGQNWADGTMPTSADPVVFPLPGPASSYVTVGGAMNADSLTFDNNYQLDSGSLNLTSRTITVAGAKTATINSTLNASGAFSKNGTGTLVLGSATNFFSGDFNINAGAVRASSEANLGSSFSTIRLFGTLEAAGTFTLTNKSIQLNGGAIKVLSGGTMTLGTSSVYDTGSYPNYSALNKDGDGTLVMSSWLSRSGPTNVNAGTMRIETNAQPGYGLLTVGSGATVEFVNKSFYNGTTVALSGSTLRGIGTSTVGVTLPATGGVTGPPPPSDIFATMSTSAASDMFNVTFSGSATSGSLITITGPGSVIPYGPSYLGTYRINGGTLRAQSQIGANSPSAGPVEVNSGGTLGLLGSPINRTVSVNDGGSVRLLIGTSMPMPTTAIASGASVTFGADITNAIMTTPAQLTGGAGATVNVVGPGTVSTGPAVTYAGGWSVNSGTLRVQGANGSLGTGTSPIAVNGGTLDIATSSLTRDIALNAGTVKSSGQPYFGTLAVAPGANVSLTGSLILGNGANDLTGGDASAYIHVNGNPGQRIQLMQPSDVGAHWLIDGGTLEAAADSHLGAAQNTITVNMFGVLRPTAAANFARNINAQGGIIDGTGFASSFENVTGTSLRKQGAGTISVNHLRLNDIFVNAAAMKIKPNGAASGTSKVANVTINPICQLDLTNNALVVTSTPIGTWGGSAYTGVTGLVANGYQGGTWQGVSGIITSESDAATGLTTLAVMPASEAALANPNEFRGVSISASDTLVGYTWGGDANLDGELNGDDYFAIDSNVSNSGSVFGYHNGDFNYDGAINGDDYFIIDSNITFAQNSPPFPTAMGGGGVAAVPEPAVCGSMLLLMAFPMRRRRQRCASRLV